MTISLTCIIAAPSVNKHTCGAGGVRQKLNADYRLAYLQVNKVNIVVKCFKRFPVPKL